MLVPEVSIVAYHEEVGYRVQMVGSTTALTSRSSTRRDHLAFLTRWLFCFGCAALAVAQTSSSTFRQKFGVPRTISKAPLKEVFTVAPKMKMIVTYGPGNVVCSLEIPPSKASAWELHRVLDDVALPSTLGKKLGELEMTMATIGSTDTRYERATVTEGRRTVDRESKNEGINIVFTQKPCGWKLGNDPFEMPQEDR